MTLPSTTRRVPFSQLAIVFRSRLALVAHRVERQHISSPSTPVPNSLLQPCHIQIMTLSSFGSQCFVVAHLVVMLVVVVLVGVDLMVA